VDAARPSVDFDVVFEEDEDDDDDCVEPVEGLEPSTVAAFGVETPMLVVILVNEEVLVVVTSSVLAADDPEGENVDISVCTNVVTTMLELVAVDVCICADGVGVVLSVLAVGVNVTPYCSQRSCSCVAATGYSWSVMFLQTRKSLHLFHNLKGCLLVKHIGITQ